jgi:drug/metabolite transporter (DMT)-like permease
MHKANPALHGMILMVGCVGVFALLDTTGKYLSRWYPVPAIVFARYAFNLIALLLFLGITGKLHLVRTTRPGIQIARGVLLGSATLLFFSALRVMPLADAAAISFVLPLFVAALAMPILGERLDAARVLAIVIGLTGALIIVRPGTGSFTYYALLPLGMAFCNALYQILTRKVSGIEPPLTSLFYGTLVGTVMFVPAVPLAWVPPMDAWHWSLFISLGCLGALGHFILIRAFDHAPATLLAPLVYTQLVWVLILGLIVFGDLPDAWSFLGMGIIVTAGLYLIRRQRLGVRG